MNLAPADREFRTGWHWYCTCEAMTLGKFWLVEPPCFGAQGLKTMALVTDLGLGTKLAASAFERAGESASPRLLVGASWLRLSVSWLCLSVFVGLDADCIQKGQS